MMPILLSAVAVCAREPSGNTGETYGYEILDQTSPHCVYHFVDISSSGSPISFQPSSAEPAVDDGGAVVVLSQPFELYGRTLPALVVSSNGYIAAAPTLATDDGGDFSHDCPLPAVPGNPGGIPSRVYVYHADLSGSGTGGEVHHQFFSDCPRPSTTSHTEACTVVQWTQWGFAFEPGLLDFQAILYHETSQVALQLRANSAPTGNATVALQGPDARSAATYACNESTPISPHTAVCFFDPRFPAGGPFADLSIVKTDKTNVVSAGTATRYSIVVANNGPSPVIGATVSDSFPGALEQCSWTCTATTGSNCSAGPVIGDISDSSADLLPGGATEYVVDCMVTSWADGTVSNTATVDLPAGVTDPNDNNNSATDDSTVVGSTTIFTDGFESGETDAWS